MSKQTEEDFMLTTFDNPFNPFNEFEAWLKFDMILGYNTCGLLAKTANTNSIQSDELNVKREIQAMKDICEREPLIYRMINIKDYNNSVFGNAVLPKQGPEGG